jgi:hypothetical protein
MIKIAKTQFTIQETSSLVLLRSAARIPKFSFYPSVLKDYFLVVLYSSKL